MIRSVLGTLHPQIDFGKKLLLLTFPSLKRMPKYKNLVGLAGNFCLGMCSCIPVT